MIWSHPDDISLHDVLTLIKGFVDILILASGYQSSGHLAHWDSPNIITAFQWPLFFENVLRVLSHSDDYQDSIEELDSALSEMTSNPYFPKGLAHLSSVTLVRARSFMIKHMVRTLPLRDSHLRAFVTAMIQMDYDQIQRKGDNYLHIYLNNLKLHTKSSNPLSDDENSSKKLETCFNNDDFLTTFAIQELTKRQQSVSLISSAETSLNILSNALKKSSLFKQPKQTNNSMVEERFLESVTWDRWRTRNLSYLLDTRTISLVSGASMIFSAPKIQWLRVFERLDLSAKNNEDDLLELIELLLLGCISSKWTSLIQHLMSICYHSLTFSTIYNEVRNLIMRIYQNLEFKEETMNPEEKSVLEYLEVVLGSQIHQLLKLSPILAAISIPSGSQLFGLYVSELESQFKGETSKFRCCCCVQERKEHRDCEVAERIWCIYIFHACVSHTMCTTKTP